jgi:hypothetical protein
LKGELETKLEVTNDRIEDVRRRERELADQVSRLKARVQEKERQNEHLRAEADRFVALHSDLEAKVDKTAPVKKPACIQTETFEEHFLVIQKNDQLVRDLNQARSDLDSLLDSYEARKLENQD